jgi:hypothetical protein
MGKTRKIDMRSFKEYSNKELMVVDMTPGDPVEISNKKLKNKKVDEVSQKTLGNYMRKSAADAGKPNTSARQQDKRIGGQKMADNKMRKAQGKGSAAKVAATEEVSVDEGDGLWHNIHKKRKEGRPMRKPGSKGAPTKQDFKNANEKKLPEGEGETTPCPSCDGSLENHNPDCPRAGNSKTGKDVATANPKAGDQKDAAMAEDNADEALDMTARRKKSRQMKRLKSRIKLGRERAKRKMADPERLKKRARKAARTEILKKLTKGVDKSQLTYARRQELEKRLDKPAIKARIDRLSKKMLPATRRKELDRRRGGASDKK